jgi:ABC-type dipeptide/oligopeptide/nickel transport system permease subunit
MAWSIIARDASGAFCVAVATRLLSFNLLGDGLRDALDPRHK